MNKFIEKYKLTLMMLGYSLFIGLLLLLLSSLKNITFQSLMPGYVCLGIMTLLVWSMDSSLESLVKEDLEDIKKGRIWTSLGYKDISGIPYKERVKKYLDRTL